jgi:hypothetical protein
MSVAHGIVLGGRMGFQGRHTMSEFGPSKASVRRTMMAVVALLAFGTATTAIGTMAFARGGGGGGGHFGGGFGAGHFGGGFGGGHFGGGFGGGHFGGGFGAGHFAGRFGDRHFERGFGGRFAGGRFGGRFRNSFEGLYDFDYGYGDCYVLTPSGYAWVCTEN